MTAGRTFAPDDRTPVRAAVFLGAGAGFRLEELLLDPPGPGKVRLPIGRLIEERIGLDDLADAFAAMRRGDGARRVVVLDAPA